MRESSIAFVWSNFGPYHVDRLEGLRNYFAGQRIVAGIEIASAAKMYPWTRSGRIEGIKHITLFPQTIFENVSPFRIFRLLLAGLLRSGARDVFLCHYERLEIFAVAVCLRLCGRRVFLMIDSKFDDKIRTVTRELRKLPFFLPYNGALVSGRRTANYLRFFGFRDDQIQLGYDTVSLARIRQLAVSGRESNAVPFQARHFAIIARLVPNKNVAMAIRAYARYCRATGADARELHIYGLGPLEESLRKLAHTLGLSGVKFRGFVQNPQLAPALAAALALILPSREEQWGLVINEALALGVPILCGDNVGARDSLVRVGVNGYVFEADNDEGLGHLMSSLCSDESEWNRLSAGSNALAPSGDVERFCEGVARAIASTRR
jgi:L-malate glycosyltransferase